MSIIKTAVFPVGGLGTRFLPATKAMPKEMLPIVDTPLIQYVVEEARACGIERIVFVTGRQKHAIENHFDHMYELEANLEAKGKTEYVNMVRQHLGMPGEILFTRQMTPSGLGHAVWCARHVVQNDPFAVLLADDFIDAEPGCLAQMVEAYEANPGNYLAAMEVEREHVSRYGIAEPADGAELGQQAVRIQGLVEKPSPEVAPSRLAVIGRYVLQPGVMKRLEKLEPGAGGEIQLTDAIAAEIPHCPTYAFHFNGQRFDCGSKLGFVQATAHISAKRGLT
jgi:UTP--glucose-1-phosphate uridylyltransferase